MCFGCCDQRTCFIVPGVPNQPDRYVCKDCITGEHARKILLDLDALQSRFPHLGPNAHKCLFCNTILDNNIREVVCSACKSKEIRALLAVRPSLDPVPCRICGKTISLGFRCLNVESCAARSETRSQLHWSEVYDRRPAYWSQR